MKTLVTGAGGFIGAHVTERLLRRGRAVRALLAPSESDRALAGLDVEIVRGDVRDADACRAAVSGCDRVFHLAALYKIWMPDERPMWDVNVTGSANILHACRRAGVERVVYTSSIAALGSRDDGTPADEETPFSHWNESNAYIQSKYLSEQVALTFAREGLPLVVVNPSFPFGVGDWAPTPTGQILIATLLRRSPGALDGGFNVVDVEDVAEGHLLAEEKGRVGERYILGNENLSVRELYALVAEVTGRKIRRYTLPFGVYYGFAAAAELASKMTRKPPVTTRAAIQYVHRHVYFDVSKARRELGLPQTDLRETIRKAVRWFEEHGYLDGQH
jgi:dihydroflavonol-4-reductase